MLYLKNDVTEDRKGHSLGAGVRSNILCFASMYTIYAKGNNELIILSSLYVFSLILYIFQFSETKEKDKCCLCV